VRPVNPTRRKIPLDHRYGDEATTVASTLSMPEMIR
jgi:hypothetical protein